MAPVFIGQGVSRTHEGIKNQANPNYLLTKCLRSFHKTIPLTPHCPKCSPWLCLTAGRLGRCLWLSENSITKEEKRTYIGWQSNNQYPACGEEESRQLWGFSWWQCLGIFNVGSGGGFWPCCTVTQLCSWLFSSPWCGELNNGSWKIYAVILGTWEYIALHRRWNFKDVIKLRFLRWGDFPGLYGWSHCNDKGLYKKEAGGQRERRCSTKARDGRDARSGQSLEAEKR